MRGAGLTARSSRRTEIELLEAIPAAVERGRAQNRPAQNRVARRMTKWQTRPMANVMRQVTDGRDGSPSRPRVGRLERSPRRGDPTFPQPVFIEALRHNKNLWTFKKPSSPPPARASGRCRCKPWWTATAKPKPRWPSSSRKRSNSGAEEICVVVYPGDADAYRAAAGPHGKRLQFVEQEKPLGYGHAVWCAPQLHRPRARSCCWSAIIFI